MIRMTFLGTAASRPTVTRNVSAVMANREGELLLFDCGEGTQRQMMRYGTGFGVRDIFLTHLHADHFLGLTGLLRTMGLQERTEPINIWSPRGSGTVVRAMVNLGVERVPFPVHIHELDGSARIQRAEYDIVTFRTRHQQTSLGYVLMEHERLGRFDPVRAEALGVPPGPLFGKLHRGETVLVKGQPVKPEEVVGPARPGRRIVYTGDTRPCKAVLSAARGADLLIHDATFGDDERDRARETWHSTAREAGSLAKRAMVKKLVLTHISSRYADDPRGLEREARSEFPGAIVAYDGMELEVPFPCGGEGGK